MIEKKEREREKKETNQDKLKKLWLRHNVEKFQLRWLLKLRQQQMEEEQRSSLHQHQFFLLLR